ncbi:MAG: peptidoglycan recognition protein family protein [Stellaceae bacterium]
MSAWKGIVGRGFDPAAFDLYVRALRWASWRPHFCVLHHTGAPTLAEWLSGPPAATRMLNLQHYYRDQLHWSGAPHLFVAPDLIWVFTPLTVPGVHSPSWNLVSWGIEMVGNYDIEDFFSGPGLQVHRNAIAALATLHEALGLSPASLRFHREDPLTTHKDCPGRTIKKPPVIAELTAALAGEHDPAPRGATEAPDAA